MKFLLFFAFLAVAFATDTIFRTPEYETSLHRSTFKKWKTHFDKKYLTIEEEVHRFTIFLENWKYIMETNKKNLGYELGLNQFADLTGGEFKLYVHGTTGSCLRGNERPLHKLEKLRRKNKVHAPTSVDWTTKGVVTPVKNQGQCGSCWAFSTTGSIESAYAIKTGQLNSLSEQELVDCSRAEGNQGCQGGLMDNGFRYVEKAGGLCSESEYPYTAKNGVCRASTCGTKYDRITGYVDVQKESATSLEEAVAKGPVSIAIEADQSSFQFYRSGVLTGSCGTRLDHGVLVVGYGTQGGQDYWKVKNSWGATWGDRGYVYICRNCNKNAGQGECGILDQPSYPTV